MAVSGRLTGSADPLASDQVVALHPMESMLAEVGSWAPAGASPEVLGVRHRLQVRRVDATAVPAQVVEFQPFGDRTLDQLVRHAVRQQKSGRAWSGVDLTIADRSVGQPRPAGIGTAALVNLRPEAFGKWGDGSRHAHKYTCTRSN